MRGTCSRRSILNVLFPIAPVLVSPWANLPQSFPNPVSHTYFSSRSFDNHLNDVTSSPVFGCITVAQNCWMFSWECVSSIVFVMKSMFFCAGGYSVYPSAANENAINASWLFIIGFQNDGLEVSCSTCSIWIMGSSTTGTSFGVIIALFLSALRSSFNFFATSLFSCLFSFHFWILFFSHSFDHPLNLLLGKKIHCHLPYLLLVLVFFLV